MIAEILSVFQPEAYHQQGVFTDDGTTLRTTGTTEPLVAAGGIGMPGAAATASASPSAIPDADLAARFKDRPWYEKPRLLAMTDLVQIRNDLRAFNLHDTEEPPLAKERVPDALLDPAIKGGRTPDGTFNDLDYPKMGAAGRRFGRNVPLKEAVPDTANLLVPNPRHVSRELMTRDTFQPATILNLLAASWIQFMVHDWFVHKRSDGAVHEIPCAPGDDFGDPVIRVPRSVPDAAPAGSTRPPAYVNDNSHWWDASQIYGSSREKEQVLRTGIGGKLVIEPTGLLPVDPVTGVNVGGFTDNWWVGLAMLHTLFTLEHNHLCDLLAHQHGDWDDQKLFARAKLINSALMAKIHTVEWTPAILPHPVVQTAMHVNWFGLAGQDVQDVLQVLNENELLGGIVGSATDHHTAPYSLTEEFVSVYRMHPLLPDEVAFHSLATGGHLETAPLPTMTGHKTVDLFKRVTVPDMFYSFGIAHPGAVTLHNYPRFLQNLRRDNGEHLDLAAVDILRDRERGVPRYNRFRRLLRKPPVTSFDELTDNPAWRTQLKTVYGNDLEAVDLMTGLYAEPLPAGFGFSETAFRIFVLMASRRLKSDRFFTNSWNEETYSQFGLDYVNKTSMRDVLLRHYPHLAPALQGVSNAFQPWKALDAAPPAAPGTR